jgi:hypothetical protein
VKNRTFEKLLFQYIDRPSLEEFFYAREMLCSGPILGIIWMRSILSLITFYLYELSWTLFCDHIAFPENCMPPSRSSNNMINNEINCSEASLVVDGEGGGCVKSVVMRDQSRSLLNKPLLSGITEIGIVHFDFFSYSHM